MLENFAEGYAERGLRSGSRVSGGCKPDCMAVADFYFLGVEWFRSKKHLGGRETSLGVDEL